jgi:hypothetical protein
MLEKGLSYVVGVLLVLGVTLGAVVVFTQVLGFQAGVLTSLQALDVRRLGESLVPVEGVIGKSGSSTPTSIRSYTTTALYRHAS